MTQNWSGSFRTSETSTSFVATWRCRWWDAVRYRREWCAHIDDCMHHVDELIEANRNFDFCWYPRSDLAKLRTMNEPGMAVDGMDCASCVRDVTGWSHRVLPWVRELRFDEMEYAVRQCSSRSTTVF